MTQAALKDPLPMVGLCDVKITPVIGEIVDLAAKYTNVQVEYRIFTTHYYKTDTHRPGDEDYGSIWGDITQDLTKFWEIFEGFREKIREPLKENILPEEQFMFGGYWYVLDGNPRECVHFTGEGNRGIRVEEFKRRYHVNEVRRCDIYGRISRLDPIDKKKEPETTFKSGWDAAGRSMNQRRRKPRTSNKIKKVK